MDVLVLGDFYTSDRGARAPELAEDRARPTPPRDAPAEAAYSVRATSG
jgi:hypothetical protein